MIEIRDVKRYYGPTLAVDGLSLEIPKGELFAFLGPNGAGKTTTIKMMVGLLQPSHGTIHISGHDVVKTPRHAALAVGYVPDQPYLYDKLSGREFLHFVADMYGIESKVAAQRIEEQIAAFELEKFVDRLSEGYSHGMKQRVVFAAAMVHDPEVIILDEPMVGLDPRSMRLVKDLLKEKSRQGTTIFISTHTLSVAEELADRIGVFDTGKLKFLGTIDELRSHLASHSDTLEQLYLRITDHTATANGTDQPQRVEANGSPNRSAGGTNEAGGSASANKANEEVLSESDD